MDVFRPKEPDDPGPIASTFPNSFTEIITYTSRFIRSFTKVQLSYANWRSTASWQWQSTSFTRYLVCFFASTNEHENRVYDSYSMFQRTTEARNHTMRDLDLHNF